MPVAKPEEVVPREPSLSWTGNNSVMKSILVRLRKGHEVVQEPALTEDESILPRI